MDLVQARLCTESGHQTSTSVLSSSFLTRILLKALSDGIKVGLPSEVNKLAGDFFFWEKQKKYGSPKQVQPAFIFKGIRFLLNGFSQLEKMVDGDTFGGS